MKHLNKIFGLSLATLSASPALAGISMTNNATTTNLVLNTSVAEPEEPKHYACTVSYIGKNLTTNHQAIIARATDCSPKAVHLKLKHYKADELANKTLEGKLGLKYKMPEHTYAYTACPLSEKTSDDPVWATGNWENNGINEMGVGTTSTLTCSSGKILEVEGESFIQEGVGEELLTTIITPQAATAKQAMEVAAKAIDDYGAQDANIIMAVDQNEAWLMEIYSRHQYCAVKMPDDKCMIAGNEFILDSLADLGISEANKENCIVSPGLLSVPKKAGLAMFDGGIEDVYHLNLFNTYALEGKATGALFSSGCHRRTWRGYSMFINDEIIPYEYNKKYPPFLTPKNIDGSINNEMSVYDIFQVYRDEFDDICDPHSLRYDENFAKDKKNGTLRTIAVQQTRQVHIMSSDPNRPKWMACDEWYTPDSANYVPYLQFNNAMTTFDGAYGYYPERFDFDENCASVLFRELNKLAWYDRENYGYPLQDFWRAFEYVYVTQMEQVTSDVAKLSQSDATNILNNFNKHVRDIYVAQVKKTKNDLLWHICDEPHSEYKRKAFIPLIDLEQYVKELGWKNYKFDGTKATFEKDSLKATYTISDGVIYGEGTLELSNGYKVTTKDSVENNKVYIDLSKLNIAIAPYSEIRTIDINEYLDKFNHLVWIIPLVCVVAVAGAITTIMLVRRKKHQPKSKK